MKNKILFLIFVLIFVMVFLSGCSSSDPIVPEDNLNTIKGIVTYGEDKEALEGAEITLKQGGEKLDTEVTDKEGLYIFTDLKDGTYDLYLSKGDDINKQREGVKVAGGSIKDVD